MEDKDKKINNKYMETLKKRGEDKHVTKSFQMTGLKIAEILNDKEHKALYIKLAKKHNDQFLLKLAKDIAEREGVENKGAYFMTVLKNKKNEENK